MVKQVSCTIIIPARNAAHTLAACLASIRALDPAPLETIVADDASDDATAQMAADGGARVLRLDRHVGQRVARNRAAQLAVGELLAFTDADCRVPPDWLAHLINALDAARCSGVTGPYARSADPRYLPQLIDRWLRYCQRHTPDLVTSSVTANLCVRTRDFLSVGGFPEYSLPWNPRYFVANEDEELAFLLWRSTGRPLRWLRDHGVDHAYRATWRSFLRQQHRFTEGILISYARFPAMSVAPKHYSRRQGVASVLVGLIACAGLLGSPVAVELLALLVVFVGYHLPCVAYLVRTEPCRWWRWTTLAVGYPFLLTVAMTWAYGLLTGGCKAVGAWCWWRVRGPRRVSLPATRPTC